MTPASRPSGAGTAAAAKKAPKAAARAPAQKAPATKAPAKKAAAKKTPATKAPAKKLAATKAPAKKTPATKAPAKKLAAARAPAQKAPATKAPAKKATAEKKPARVRAAVGPYASDAKFLEEQRMILLAERTTYQEQADALRAEADSLAQEREPGDVQFDEESGEGGTVTVDRERDLALSGQALAAVEEIEDSLVRITKKTYGACERCHQPIVKARLRALPYARLCVACKSGGLSRR
ncbi:MAG: TraR/DksA family transcriptional regulator [Acidimicrobiales bacterium]